MAHWIKNRQTALVLALVAAMFMSPMLTGPSFAGNIGGSGKPDPEQPPGDGKGDPDVPTGPAYISAPTPGAQRVFVTQPREPQTVGDGRVPYGAWKMWRLRIVLQGLRVYTFRF